MSVIDLAEIDTQAPRRARIRVVVVLTLAGVAAFIAAALTVRSEPALGELRVREPSVSVSVQGAGFTPAEEGQRLDVRDAVRTDDSGEAQIDFFDGSLVRLDVGTSLVVRELANAPAGRRIALEIDEGRTWNTVERSTSGGDRFQVRGPNAVASVQGTTFVADGRFAPTWYYLGQDGRTQIDPPDLDSFVLGAGDCVRVDPAQMRECTDHERDALVDDWIRLNQALDEAEIKKVEVTTQPPTATPALGTSGATGGSSRPGPERTAAAQATRRPSVTDSPTDPDDSTDDPAPRRPQAPSLPSDSTNDNDAEDPEPPDEEPPDEEPAEEDP